MDLTQSSSLFLKGTIAGPRSNSSISMENNSELNGFSAVKLKLVEDHSFSAEFARGSDDKTDLTHVRVFILNNSFSKYLYFYKFLHRPYVGVCKYRPCNWVLSTYIVQRHTLYDDLKVCVCPGSGAS